MKYSFENPADITITKTFQIVYYEIGTILLVPNISAVVQVIFYDKLNTRYDRSFLLIDSEDKKDYSNWQSDDYLYSYINQHFQIIFDN